MYILFAAVIVFIVSSLYVILFSKRDWRTPKKDGIGDALFNIFFFGLATFILALILKFLFG